MVDTTSHLECIRAALATAAAADGAEALAAARADLAEALHGCLLEVAQGDVPEEERQALDAALCAETTGLRGALFKGLRACALHRAFLGLPRLLEATRLLLTAAPAKGVATFFEIDLCADIDASSSLRDLDCVLQVLDVLLGGRRLKKDLGTDLPAFHKKSVRTALNRAKKAFGALEAEAHVQQVTARQAAQTITYEMPDTDCRREDEEREARRCEAHSAGIDAMLAAAKIG